MRRRVPTVLVTILVALLAVPLMLLAAAFVTFNTPQGRYVLEVATEWVSGGTVRLEGLSGRFPDRLRLRRLSIRDPHGAWMTADDIALDWSPRELLQRRTRIEQLTATRVELRRAPDYPVRRTRPRRQQQTPFELPFTVQLDRFTLPQVDLAAALAGNATALRIEGGGSFRSLRQAALEARAQRLDRQPSAYELSLQSNAEHVQGRLDLQEDANGPLTNLVGLPGLGALSVHLELLGPPHALTTTLDARAGPMRAQANGTVDLPALTATLRLSLEAPAMTLRPGFSWRRVSLQAQSQGAFIAPTTSAHLTLEGLDIGVLKLESLQAALNGVGRGVDLDATLAGLRLPDPIDTMFAHAPVRLQGQARMVSANGVDMDLTLEHPLLRAQAHYELGTAGSSLQPSTSRPPRRGREVAPPEQRNGGTLVATLPQLGPWAQLAQLNLQGRGSVSAGLAVQKDATRITVSTDLQLSDGDAFLTQLLGSRAQLGAAMTIRPEQIQLEHAQLSSAFVTASAHGTQQDQRLDIAWQAGLSDLARLSSGVTGKMNAQGRVQGTLPRLSATADLSSELTVQGQPAALHALLEARDLPQQPSSRVQVEGSLAGAPLSMVGNVSAAPADSFTLALERVDWKSAHGDATLRVDGDLLAPVGTVALRVGDLQDFAALLGQPLRGAAEASVVFEHSGSHSRARVKLDGHDVSLATTRLAKLQLHGLVNDPLRSPRLALQLSSEVQMQSAAVTLAARADGALDALAVTVEAHPDEASPASGSATNGTQAALAGSSLQARATWGESRQQLTIQELELRYREQSLRLAAPALISFQDGINIERLHLQWPPAQLEIQGRLTPQLALHASVHNFNPKAVGLVMPLVQAQGHTDIEADLHGELTHPTGKVSLTAGGLSATAGAARGLPSATLKVDVQLEGTAAQVDATLSAGSRMQLHASGTVPLQRSGSIAMHLTGGMELAVANPVLEASGQRLLGQMTVEAQFSGTPAAPEAHGSLQITHGDLQDYPRGFHISDLNLALDADGPRLELKQLDAKAGAGTLSATGNVDLSDPGMPLELELRAQNAEPLKSDLLTTNLDADFKVTGALRGELSAMGTVKINKATINIPNALPPDVQTLEVVRPGQGAPPAPPKPMFAHMDLTLNAPRGIFVRGRGLNAEVGGTVHVSGNSSSPLVSGGFDLINGLMDIAGATLNFSSGRVSFNGTGLERKIDPTIDFVATSSLGGANSAKLEVSGYADAPVITLSSNQNLPPDQILAQLLFGENASQLTALQAAGIASALVTLTGAGGGGLNPLNTVQHALGLNRLVISSNSTQTQTGAGSPAQPNNSGVTIQAGRYVSNRVYVGAKQNTTGLTQAQVQVDITRQLKVQTTLSTGGGTVQGAATPENDPGSSIGVSYQFHY